MLNSTHEFEIGSAPEIKHPRSSIPSDTLHIKRPAPLPVGFDQAGGEEFGELGLEGGAVGSGEGDGLAIGQGFVAFEKRGELTGEGGKGRAARIEALLEAGDLLADTAQEEDQPRRPIGIVTAPSGLGAAQGGVVGFLALLDDAFQGAVGHMAVARPEQEESGEDAGKPAIAVLERMNGEKDDYKNADPQQGMQPGIRLGAAVPVQQSIHVARCIEGAGGLEDNAQLPSLRIESGNVIRQGFPIAAMALVLDTVL